MLEWVLDSYYRERFHQMPEAEQAIIVWEGNEGTLLDLMRRIEATHAGLSVFSLPSFGNAAKCRHIELGVRGAPAQVPAAMLEIRAEVSRLGFQWDELDRK